MPMVIIKYNIFGFQHEWDMLWNKRIMKFEKHII